jgi:hypothetical protein
MAVKIIKRYVGYGAGYAEGRLHAPSDELRTLDGAGRSLASRNRLRPGFRPGRKASGR